MTMRATPCTPCDTTAGALRPARVSAAFVNFAKTTCPIARSNEVRTDDDLQQRRRRAVAKPVGEPPQGRLAHAPRRDVAGEQIGCDLAERGLMTDDEHRLARVRPAGGSENRGRRR